MSEILCSSPLQRLSDFFQEGGAWIDGACGPAALANAATSVLGHSISPHAVYDLMRANSLCDPSGASIIGGLWNAAHFLGCEVAAFQPYGEPWTGWGDWLVAQIAAGNPVVFEVALGQALVDTISGQGENYVGSLNYHYFAILGMNSGGASALTPKGLLPGFWCADGDNWAGGNGVANGFNCTNQLQFYTDAIMTAARPCAAIALKGRVTHVAWTKTSDGRGQDDQGHSCGQGFIDTLIARGETGVDGLMSETYFPDGSESFLPLANGDVYTYSKASNAVSTGQGAQVATKLWGLLEAAEKATSAPASDPFEPKYTALKAAVEAALSAN